MDSITTQIQVAERELDEAVGTCNRVRERMTELQALYAEQESVSASLAYLNAGVALSMELDLANRAMCRALDNLLSLRAKAAELTY